MNLEQYFKSTNDTQELLAARVGRTQGAVSHWINGRAKIPPTLVLTLEKETKGKVKRHEMRPDIYPVSARRKNKSSLAKV